MTIKRQLDDIDAISRQIAKDLAEFKGEEFKKATIRIKYPMGYNKLTSVFEKLEEFGFQNKRHTIVVPQ